MKEDDWGKCMGFWSLFRSNELKAIRDRALYFVFEREDCTDPNPDETAALKKMAQGCEDFLSIITERDKRIRLDVEARTGRKVNPVTGYVE